MKLLSVALCSFGAVLFALFVAYASAQDIAHQKLRSNRKA